MASTWCNQNGCKCLEFKIPTSIFGDVKNTSKCKTCNHSKKKHAKPPNLKADATNIDDIIEQRVMNALLINDKVLINIVNLWFNTLNIFGKKNMLHISSKGILKLIHEYYPYLNFNNNSLQNELLFDFWSVSGIAYSDMEEGPYYTSSCIQFDGKVFYDRDSRNATNGTCIKQISSQQTHAFILKLLKCAQYCIGLQLNESDSRSTFEITFDIKMNNIAQKLLIETDDIPKNTNNEYMAIQQMMEIQKFIKNDLCIDLKYNAPMNNDQILMPWVLQRIKNGKLKGNVLHITD